MDMEHSTKFANSLAAMAEGPIAAANRRIDENKNGMWLAFGPTFGRDGEMERAEKELTENLRERALGLITVQEAKDGQILLKPEENPLGHFAGTSGREEAQLATFYEKSLPKGMPVGRTMYSNHSDASRLQGLAETHIEDMDEACQLRTCFEHGEGIRTQEE